MAATDHARVYMCALDFIRALNERPLLAKWLCRLLFGRWAYGEFMWMIQNIERDGHSPFYSYGLEHASYHRSWPWRWWNQRRDAAKEQE